MEVLRIEGLRKRFARGDAAVQANDGVDLAIERGQVVGLLGHNGAGKSTLVNQVVGLLRPDAGSISVGGVDAVARPDLARRLVSVQAQANVPITGLSPRVAIELVGRMRGGRRASVRDRTSDLLAALALDEWANTRSEKVSGGIARLTAFAMAAVEPGRLVVLDEPTNDVDPVRRRLLWAEIRRLADDGAAVLLVTHNVREAEQVVDHLTILDNGKVLASGTPGHLTRSADAPLQLDMDLADGLTPRWSPELGHFAVTQLRASATVPGTLAGAAVSWAERERRAGRIQRYSLSPRSLEDVYVALVNHEEEAA